MPKKLISHRQRPTHFLIWCAAVICAILAVAVIIVGIAVFIGYLVVHPRIPYISVTDGHLNAFQFDYAGLLETQVTVVIRAENDNRKAHATFSDVGFTLVFDGIDIARLAAEAFDVRKNSSIDLPYVATSLPIPLDPEQMEYASISLKEDRVTFELRGSARAQWRVGVLGSVRFWCHLNCNLRFHPSNGTYIRSRCSSKAK
ncbi:hypothetical protein HS088_TW04G01080 [Tripterygium wilfordii]|uniref:Late embryogenesis abundant protein LEA-2 subgroup domain-containing protein n=1 Tax=Tripterygium wilfordii TaxID=458696 RepID=A0A7J7DRW3_TRIWF|nr:hypothetical protein HS088_TW04G01080 [Tripterygium wilfordii]